MGCPFGSAPSTAPTRPTRTTPCTCCARASPATWLGEHARAASAPALACAIILLSIAWSWVEYWGTPAVALGGWALLAAKTCVSTAQASFGLVFLPVTRGLVTRVRSTRLRKAFDCDAAINYHAWLAGIGAVAGCAHGLFVTVAALVWTAKPAEEQMRLGAPGPLTLRDVAASRVFVSGIALVGLLACTYPFATGWPRRSAWLAGTRVGAGLNSFQNFWAAHHVLYIAFPALLLVHAWPPLPTSALLAARASRLQRALGSANKTAILLLPPLALYLLDRCVRAWRSRSSAAPRLLSARLFPGGVLELILSKPAGFKYSPGQYVHLACPALSAYEWHPFTLTSAPGDRHLALAIKAAGDWTAALLALVADQGQVYGGQLVPAGLTWEEARAAAERVVVGRGRAAAGVVAPVSGAAGRRAARPAAASDDVEATEARKAVTSPRTATRPGVCDGDSVGSEAGGGGKKEGVGAAGGAPAKRRRSAPRPARLPYSFRIDGPWGAPTQDYADHDSVVLVGAGIGITPMVSVLRSLLHELNHARCPHCAHVNPTMMAEHTRVRRVLFAWSLPDIDGLAWFGRALTEIAAADGLGLMDLRIHLTRSGPATVGEEAGEGGGRGGGEEDGDDDAAGRRTFGGRLAALRAAGVSVHAGRPDFQAIIARAQAEAGPSRSVGVFFCGPGGLAREVRDICRALNRQRGRRAGCAAAAGGGGSEDDDGEAGEEGDGGGSSTSGSRPGSAGSAWQAAPRGAGRIVFRSEVFCKNSTAPATADARGGG